MRSWHRVKKYKTSKGLDLAEIAFTSSLFGFFSLHCSPNKTSFSTLSFECIKTQYEAKYWSGTFSLPQTCLHILWKGQNTEMTSGHYYKQKRNMNECFTHYESTFLNKCNLKCNLLWLPKSHLQTEKRQYPDVLANLQQSLMNQRLHITGNLNRVV